MQRQLQSHPDFPLCFDPVYRRSLAVEQNKRAIGSPAVNRRRRLMSVAVSKEPDNKRRQGLEWRCSGRGGRWSKAVKRVQHNLALERARPHLSPFHNTCPVTPHEILFSAVARLTLLVRSSPGTDDISHLPDRDQLHALHSRLVALGHGLFRHACARRFLIRGLAVLKA